MVDVMYTLSSPTVIATDAATHAQAAELLRALADAFRISQDGSIALAAAWHDREVEATDLAWGMVGMMDLNAPSLPQTLGTVGKALGAGVPIDPKALATGRFGTATQAARLIADEASVWPDAAIADLPGVGRVPASAAVAAAAVAAWWACPELDEQHAQVLRAPFEQALAGPADLFETGLSPYGPTSSAVLELINLVRDGGLSASRLAAVTWPGGVWSRAMHEAAWACLRAGRLRLQMRAVLDVTLEFVLAEPEADPVTIRAALPALHAMTVHRLIGDVLADGAGADLVLADLSI